MYPSYPHTKTKQGDQTEAFGRINSLIVGSSTTRSKAQIAPSFNLEGAVTFYDHVKDYKKVIRAGGNATTTLQGSEWRVIGDGWIGGSHQRGGLRTYGEETQYEGSVAEFYGDPTSLMESYVPTVDADLDSAIESAKTAFVSKALNFQRAMQGGVFLGEFRQALSLIRRPAMSLRNEVTHLFRTLGSPGGWYHRYRQATHKVNRRAYRKAVAETWLEASFGMQPLVNDIDDAMKAAARTITYHPPSKWIMTRGSSDKTFGNAVLNIGSSMVGIDKIDLTIQRTSHCEAKYYGRVSARTTYSDPISNQFGLTWHDVLPTAYELIPYSFLLDYFSNLQEIINAISICSSSVEWVARGTSVERNARAIKMEVDYGTYSPDDTKQIEALALLGRPWLQNRFVSRSPIAGSLIPSLEFEIPGFGKKWLNMAALLAAGKAANKFSSLG